MIYQITYSSMTACYDLGYIRSKSKEVALKYARATNTAFSGSEKSLINARPVTKSEERNITLSQVKDV